MEDQTPTDGTASPAYPILAGDSALSDENKADLFDIFYATKDPAELTQKLQVLAVPEDTKKRLLTAKQASMPPVDPIKSVLAVGDAMKSVDPATLDLMESHPTIFKTLAAAAAPAKPAKEASGASPANSKGKQAKTTQEEPTVTPDVPATPPGHALVRASDGGLHHIPLPRMDEARTLDPKLKILHVQPDEA